jgi:hypothetical protein
VTKLVTSSEKCQSTPIAVNGKNSSNEEYHELGTINWLQMSEINPAHHLYKVRSKLSASRSDIVNAMRKILPIGFIPAWALSVLAVICWLAEDFACGYYLFRHYTSPPSI